jgi:Heparinase II/III-like protein/Heparinase II/III N-terminus
MRSPAEICFRVRQEAVNIASWISPPQLPQDFAEPTSPLAGLPDPGPIVERLRNSDLARDAERIATLALQGKFVLFGEPRECGPSPDWRRDFLAGISSESVYFRRVPYLQPASVGDHKVIWELNRHQFLVAMAQAWRFTGRAEFLRGIEGLLESWYAANPPWSGMNWCSALEVAFRAWSWIWVWHLAGASLSEGARRKLMQALYQHGCYLDNNLSFYFAPNTHLLGEAVVLGALGRLFPKFPGAARWRDRGTTVVRQQLETQIQEDGSHFEQSSYYHVYALDMFLAHYAMTQEEPPAKITRAAEFLHGLLGPQREIPLLGDDDGGRFFHPYGEGRQFGRATLATAAVLLKRRDWPRCETDLEVQAAWWLGAEALRDAHGGEKPATAFFPNAGLWNVIQGNRHIVIDAGAFGRAAGGHSHADTLSLVLRVGDEEILIDPGTYTYLGDASARDRFRSSAAHNTVRAAGRDQAVPAGPFRWTEKPTVRVLDRGEHFLEAECTTGVFTHRRRFELYADSLVVTDHVHGARPFEQFWHFGADAKVISPGVYAVGSGAQLIVTPGADAHLTEGGDFGWRSTVYGQKRTSPVLRVVLPDAPPYITRILWTS